jgi:phosphoribosylformylglycinamidine synthase
MLREVLSSEVQATFIGEVTDDGVFTLANDTFTTKEAMKVWRDRLESVYPTRSEISKKDITSAVFDADTKYSSKIKVAKPRVFIPVFPGTNCEYDAAKAFERAGARAETIVFKNRNEADIKDSADAFVKAIENAQMLMFPGGFSAGDEPDGSAKFIASVMRNPKIADAVQGLLDRDGLILGICNGFQALIKLGLVPFGEIIDTDEHCPTLTFNTISRHQSKIVNVRVASNMSPWLADSEPGDIYSVPVSHGEGRFICEPELFKKLVKNGQIATQYVDLDGHPTMNIQFNPNGSYYAVEGITSPDGRVLGKMGHAERWGHSLYKNVPGNYDMGLFRAAKEYFE